MVSPSETHLQHQWNIQDRKEEVNNTIIAIGLVLLGAVGLNWEAGFATGGGEFIIPFSLLCVVCGSAILIKNNND